MILPLAVAAAVEVAPAERAAILQTAHQAIARRIGKTPKLLVRTLGHQGDWVFLVATMQDQAGRPISYAGTPLASAEAQGMISKEYVALFRRSGKEWRVVEEALGPTDVAWADWAEKHGAPKAIFG
ncbi:hypothetical protein S2M10_01290 [Sphingomonas sp. S2M10]|uniref:hypothetical protein n=1 Tax=Sphingomonas sp. S2M10 TaxID=2705010 RepID=UPI00145754D5|nr:hypothetical protein [Sphingomonas sp. S2M10]NLS25166.1 hypothetical protein [Sphingomonas sp. S2M10]